MMAFKLLRKKLNSSLGNYSYEQMTVRFLFTILRGSVPKNGPIDCASKNYFSLNSADGKGLVPKY